MGTTAWRAASLIHRVRNNSSLCFREKFKIGSTLSKRMSSVSASNDHQYIENKFPESEVLLASSESTDVTCVIAFHVILANLKYSLLILLQ